MVCRDTSLWGQSVAKVKKVFSSLICQSIPHEVNKVIYCRNDGDQQDKIKKNSASEIESQMLADFKSGLQRLASVLGKDVINDASIMEHTSIL